MGDTHSSRMVSFRGPDGKDLVIYLVYSHAIKHVDQAIQFKNTERIGQNGLMQVYSIVCTERCFCEICLFSFRPILPTLDEGVDAGVR